MTDPTPTPDTPEREVAEYVAPPHDSLPPWEDPQVQIAYRVLCDTTPWPDEAEHHEGVYARRIVHALLAAPASPPAQGWQDMASAPRDGSDVLIWTSVEIVCAYWDAGHNLWRFATDREGGAICVKTPTAWQPLPAAPGEPTPAAEATVGEAARTHLARCAEHLAQVGYTLQQDDVDFLLHVSAALSRDGGSNGR